MKNEILKDFWENKSNLKHSHLTDDFMLVSSKGKKIIENLKNIFINLIDWKGKIVIDYGIGASLIGHYLLKEKGIKKYIGYDVSNRSIATSKKILREFPNKDYVLLEDQNYTFNKWNADIFISLACIQHFPTEDYLINFLKELDVSGIPTLILQIRYRSINSFPVEPYKEYSEVIHSCWTNKEFLMGFLKNYNCRWESDINKKSKYQYLIFDKN